MKLIDILVEELPKHGGWPDGAVFVAQEEGGELWSFTSKPQKDCDDEWMDESHHGYHTKVGKLPEASDHDVSTITREQYEAALAAKNEGWIEWGGGKYPPVSTNTVVDFKFKNGDVLLGYAAGEYSWGHTWQNSNIIAYRLHKPQEAEQAEADDEADLNECIGKDSAPVWNGEGLPPVGCECEYSLNGGKTWWKCKIDYIVGTQGVVMLCDTFEGVQYVQFSSYGNALKFRPIRSETERKRDAAKNAIAELCRSSASNGHSADLIYDAIAAGEIPGVKLED